jgi:ubiquitin-protein ligase
VDQSSREARLKADHEALQAVQAASTIFSFETTGEPPDRYTLSFRGKGLGRDASSQSEVTTIDLHKVDLRMPYSYPQSPPDIRWLTPIMHPNVSFSGFVNLADIGLVWSKEVPLEMVCERLWDVVRAEFLNLNKASNYAAKNWFEKENKQPLPVDHRPLRDRGGAGGTNVVRYERRAGRGVQLAGATTAGEVMFIDESTPTPQMPARKPYVPVERRRRPEGEDVIYIGPE